MPRKRGGVVLAGAALLCAAAPAVQAQRATELNIGASALRFDFRELSEGGEQLVRELGTLPGVVAGVGHTSGDWHWSAEFSWHAGAVGYDGQTQSGAAFDSTTDMSLTVLRARGLHRIDAAGRFAAGFGVGYRQWRRNIRGRGPVGGLDERATAGAVSLDARVSVLRSDASTIDIDLQLAWPIHPQLKVDFGGRYDAAVLRPSPRPAARVSVPAAWAWGPDSRLIVEPGVEVWGFGRSATETLYRDGVPAGVVYQPQGKGLGVDLKVLWAHAF